MSRAQSAGLLMFRRRDEQLEVFLVHPGGPYFARKDAGAWTIPKGEFTDDEHPLAAACREFAEETGQVPKGEFHDLGTVKQKGGKLVYCWAFKGDWLDGDPPKSNSFEMEWPPRSGKRAEFPEIDKAEFFDVENARTKINPAQIEFIDRLIEIIK